MVHQCDAKVGNHFSQISKQSVVTNYLFKPGAWLAKLNFINHLVLFNNVLMIVLAEEKGGKTTFIKLLQDNLDSKIQSISLTASESIQFSDLYNQCADILFLHDERVKTLSELISKVNQCKSHVLFIIDDAQCLPVELLIDLFQCIAMQGEKGFFHVCLVSDYSINSTLNKLNNPEYKNLIHTIEPGSLSESETKTYLLNYLPASKYVEKALTSKVLKEFYALTHGNIAIINREKNNFFNSLPYKRERAKLYSAKNIIAISLFMVALGFSYIWQSQGNISIVTKPEKIQVIENSSIAEPTMISQIPAMHVAAIIQSKELGIIADSAFAVRESAQDSTITKNVLSNNLNQSLETPNYPTDLPNVVYTSSIPSYRKFMAMHNKTEFHEPITNQYTIQLLASKSFDQIQHLIKRHHLADQLKVRKTSNWYIVTLGEYRNLKEAQQALKHLPTFAAQLNHQMKPWIRLVSFPSSAQATL